jgi:hypothetical protein
MINNIYCIYVRIGNSYTVDGRAIKRDCHKIATNGSRGSSTKSAFFIQNPYTSVCYAN